MELIKLESLVVGPRPGAEGVECNRKFEDQNDIFCWVWWFRKPWGASEKVVSAGKGGQRHTTSLSASSCLLIHNPISGLCPTLQEAKSVSLVAQSCLMLCNPWTAACQASLSITNSQSLLKFMSIESVMPSNHLILYRPLLLLPSIFPSIMFFFSEFFSSGGQSIGASGSASVLPVNIQDWFPLGLICLISLQSERLLRVFSNTTVQKHQFLGAQLSLWSNSHPYIDTDASHRPDASHWWMWGREGSSFGLQASAAAVSSTTTNTAASVGASYF